MKFLTLQNIRTRLTAWNILVFGSILTLYAVGTSWFFLSTLSQQLDESLKEELELVDQMLFHLPEGEYLIDTHTDDAMRLERFIELWSSDGHLLYRSKMLGNRSLGAPPDSLEFRGGIRSVTLDDGTRLRVASKLHTDSSPVTLVRLSVNEDEYLGGVHRFVNMVLIVGPIGLLLITVSSYLLARRALSPINVMASTARRLTAEALHERIPVRTPGDELDRLALSFNDLLERVEKSFLQLKRFTSDASHQLRTPLTTMRSVGEVGLQTSRTIEEYREVVGSMLEESDRLTHLVEDLLFLSRADAGRHTVSSETIDLLEFTRETADMVRILWEENEQQLHITGMSGNFVFADRTLLCQALINVIDNAIRFTPAGGTISIDVSSTPGTSYVAVTDSGPGIPPSEQERIFERFYQLGMDGDGGTGLGLAIARWAAEANNGTITVHSDGSSGSTFILRLPRLNEP